MEKKTNGVCGFRQQGQALNRGGGVEIHEEILWENHKAGRLNIRSHGLTGPRLNYFPII